MGWDLLVVGSEPTETVEPAGKYLLDSVPPTIRVERVPTVPQRPRPLLFPTINHTFLEALATCDTARAAIGRDHYDVIIATGPPFHVFVGGYYLARSLRTRLVLDYRDEWTENQLGFLRLGRSDRKWEVRCLRAADAVVFVTDSQLERSLCAFPELDRNKCTVVRNGWEPADDAAVDDVVSDASDTRSDSHLVLSFVGYTADFTRIDCFLSALNMVLLERPDLKDIVRLRFVGRRDAEGNRELEHFAHQEILEIHDQVSKRDATAFMRSSNALIALNPPTFSRCLPTKIFDYVAARRPILVFGEGGETAAVVRELDAGVVVPSDDPGALAIALDRLARGEVTCSLSGRRDDWLAAHTREQLAKEFFEVLDRVINGRREGAKVSSGP